MRRIVISAVMSAMLLQTLPVFAATAGRLGSGQTQASVTGTATGQDGEILANMTIQLRDLSTGQLVGVATSTAAGGFTFMGIGPGNYVVEAISADGHIVGTSAPVMVGPDSAVTGITVTVAGGPAAQASSRKRVWIAAAAGVGAAATVAGVHGRGHNKDKKDKDDKKNASPSR